MTDFIIYPGTVSKQFLLNNGTALRNFPVQVDMTNGRVWVFRPGNGSGIVVPAKFVETITGDIKAYGGFTFPWPLQGLTPLMSKYFRDTYMNSSYSGDVTVSTFNRETGAWEYYNAKGRWPNVKSEAEMALGGLHNVNVTFVNAIAAFDGPDMTLTEGGTTTWLVTATTDIDFTADNVGDDETFNIVYVTVDITANVDYSSHSATGWTAEYSINSGTSYSGTPPGDLTTVTNVRFDRNDVLIAGNSYDVITVTFDGIITGASTITSDVSTVGDNDKIGRAHV